VYRLCHRNADSRMLVIFRRKLDGGLTASHPLGIENSALFPGKTGRKVGPKVGLPRRPKGPGGETDFRGRRPTFFWTRHGGGRCCRHVCRVGYAPATAPLRRRRLIVASRRPCHDAASKTRSRQRSTDSPPTTLARSCPGLVLVPMDDETPVATDVPAASGAIRARAARARARVASFCAVQ
jgi:hypothetical protein